MDQVTGKAGLPLVAELMPVTPPGSCFHPPPVRQVHLPVRHLPLPGSGNCGDGLSGHSFSPRRRGLWLVLGGSGLPACSFILSPQPPPSPVWSSLSPSTIIINPAQRGAIVSHGPLLSHPNVPVSPKMFQKKNRFHLGNTEKPPKDTKSPS